MPTGDPEAGLKRVDLGEVDVEAFLNGIKVYGISDAGRDFRFSCPYPEHSFGDKSPSAYMNKETTAFICFSCGKTGNAVTVLADVMEVSRTQARHWIAQKWGTGGFVEPSDLKNYIMSKLAPAQVAPPKEILAVLDEARLVERAVDWQAAFEHYIELTGDDGPLIYMLSRLMPETLTKFEVCYDHFSQRPCLTVRDEHGSLVGFKGRAWRDDQVPKYLVIGDTERSIAAFGVRYGFAPYDASQYVYGLDRARPVDGTYIFCEGEINVMAMHQLGFENTIGPSGSTVSAEQVRKIIERCEEIIVFFDYDIGDPGKEVAALMKIANVVALFEPFIVVRVVDRHRGDPNSNLMSREEVIDLVNGAQSSYKRKIMQMIGLTS